MSDDDYAFHTKKNPGKTYVSRRFPDQTRIASKVMDSDEGACQARERGQVVLRRTHGGRQGIVPRLFEDRRQVHTLTLQRWNVEKEWPQERIHFSFVGSEIE